MTVLDSSLGGQSQTRRTPIRIMCVVGTRPEVIKMAPVVKALERNGMEASILTTAQHRGLLDQMMLGFGLKSTWDLNAMLPDQSLASLTGLLIPQISSIFATDLPDVVLAQGDTATVFCAALSAYYIRIPFGHIEAGLRSGDMSSPFPEEGMRKLTAVLSHWHFAPTLSARNSLISEGVNSHSIHVVGNTVIDSLLEAAKRDDLPWPPIPQLQGGERLLLMTLHRRESFGEPIRRILGAVKEFAIKHPQARILYPVHPNPNVYEVAVNILGALPNVHLVEPLDYHTLVSVLKKAFLVITDSGGLQEESPALGKPVVILREVTERPEIVTSGGACLVGSDPTAILGLLEKLWSDNSAYKSMAIPRFPYGDGSAAEKIAGIIQRFFNGIAI